MRNYLFFIILYLIAFGALHAQNTYHPEQHELLYLNNHWVGTNNAAGLSFSDFQVHGNTELGYSDTGGSLHRAQEGNRKSGLKFISERFDKISDKWLTWGSFEFQMNNEENRAWSNVFNTYNNSPYLFGDSVKGRYDLQFFDLHAKISRKLNNRWALGIGLDYYAGDMSRQRDARTRTYLVNYAAYPSVVFQLSDNQTLGFTGGFRFEKEKMPGITTVQISPKIDYYFFLGNENSYSLLDGYTGFDRQYVNLDYSLGLQHNIKNDKLNWFNSVEFTTKNQEVLGSERESPGTYTAMKFNFLSKLNYKLENKLLNITLNGLFNAGRADEFLQERKEVRDTVNGSVSWVWNTLYAYKGRYTTDSYTINLKANLRDILENGADYSWVAGIEGQFYGFKNQYYLPYSSFESQRIHVGANGGLRVFNKKEHRISINAKGGFGFGFNNKLDLNSIANTIPTIGSSTFEKATFKIANEIMKPDLAFYKQNVLDYGIDARYSFPFKLKNNSFVGLAKIFYNNQISSTLGSWSMLGVSVGLITF
jgi:hypothetical protein